MDSQFCRVLCQLRKGRALSQRAVAGDLGISQALLSHYENGMREPGLGFVVRACDYYGVSADYLLGRTDIPESYAQKLSEIQSFAAELQQLCDRAQSFSGQRKIN